MGIGIHRDEIIKRADPAVVGVLADPHLVDGDDIGIGALRQERVDQARLQGGITKRLDIDADAGHLGELIGDALKRQIPGIANSEDVDCCIRLGGDAGEVAQRRSARQRGAGRSTSF